jgi:hypothetical protein
VDTKPQPGPTKRRQYSEALKRQMVAETQAPPGICVPSWVSTTPTDFQASLPKTKFAADSALEEGGLELVVPL